MLVRILSCLLLTIIVSWPVNYNDNCISFSFIFNDNFYFCLGLLYHDDDEEFLFNGEDLYDNDDNDNSNNDDDESGSSSSDDEEDDEDLEIRQPVENIVNLNWRKRTPSTSTATAANASYI